MQHSLKVTVEDEAFAVRLRLSDIVTMEPDALHTEEMVITLQDGPVCKDYIGWIGTTDLNDEGEVRDPELFEAVMDQLEYLDLLEYV